MHIHTHLNPHASFVLVNLKYKSRVQIQGILKNKGLVEGFLTYEGSLWHF